MAKKKEITVEEKLRALYDLQLIDSRIDEIRSVRGELPLEVEDLEDDIAGLNTRLSNLSEDVANLETDISNKKLAIEECFIFGCNTVIAISLIVTHCDNSNFIVTRQFACDTNLTFVHIHAYIK